MATLRNRTYDLATGGGLTLGALCQQCCKRASNTGGGHRWRFTEQAKCQASRPPPIPGLAAKREARPQPMHSSRLTPPLPHTHSYLRWVPPMCPTALAVSNCRVPFLFQLRPTSAPCSANAVGTRFLGRRLGSWRRVCMSASDDASFCVADVGIISRPIDVDVYSALNVQQRVGTCRACMSVTSS